MLRAALGLAALHLTDRKAYAADREGGNTMAKDIVMIHGANEGGWCFDKFGAVFQGLGWTCHAPDLIGHGTKAADAAKTLIGVGMADYRAELEAFLDDVAAEAGDCSAIRWAACLPSSSRRKGSPVR